MTNQERYSEARMAANDKRFNDAEQRRRAEAIINRCKFELSTNFECPSEQILGVYGAQIGLDSRGMLDLLASRIEA